MPLAMPAMACSRTPKWMFRPSPVRPLKSASSFSSSRSRRRGRRRPPGATGPSSRSRSWPSPRPPASPLSRPPSTEGRSASQPAGRSPAWRASTHPARSGFAPGPGVEARCHSACASPPRCTAVRKCSSASAGTKKGSSCSHPRAFFVAEDLFLAERAAVGFRRARLVRRAVADRRLTTIESRSRGLRLRPAGSPDRSPRVRVAVLHVEHLPSVRLVALPDVFGERDGGRTVERHVVRSHRGK